MESLPSELLERIMWSLVFFPSSRNLLEHATLCRSQLVNKKWREAHKSVDARGREYEWWIRTPSYVPSDPKLFRYERLAFCPPYTQKMSDNRKRAHRQGVAARSQGMPLNEWRKSEAKRLKTTVAAIKNGCEGTVQ